MTNQNRWKRTPHYVIAIVALVLAFAGLPGGAFGQAKPGTSDMKIGDYRIRQLRRHAGNPVGKKWPSGAVLF
mgnify:CR=1 FL=1